MWLTISQERPRPHLSAQIRRRDSVGRVIELHLDYSMRVELSEGEFRELLLIFEGLAQELEEDPPF